MLKEPQVEQNNKETQVKRSGTCVSLLFLRREVGTAVFGVLLGFVWEVGFVEYAIRGYGIYEIA